MVSDIMQGISLKLNQLFGDHYKVYIEDVKQGLDEPCFFIRLDYSSAAAITGTRKFRKHCFDIHYFPENPGSKTEMQDIAFQLVDGIEYITLLNGAKLRGTGINYQMVDSVLHFFINYNLFTIQTEETEVMEDLTQKDIIVGG